MCSPFYTIATSASRLLMLMLQETHLTASASGAAYTNSRLFSCSTRVTLKNIGKVAPLRLTAEERAFFLDSLPAARHGCGHWNA